MPLRIPSGTASVDVETEREIQLAINDLIGSRTIIVIAHRLSTVKRADNILVFKDGEVRESGTHEELMALGGEYYRLVMSQWGD